jgi:glyoxylase-like metal-dependent hydrolase (beta-lactamase superfamily II)
MKIVYPSMLVDTHQTLIMGKDTIELIYPGKAHTDGDLVARIKTRKTYVMGDLLFTNCFPYIDPLGSAKNWYEQLNIIAQSDTKYFIPGHCNLADKEDLVRFSGYLKDLYNDVKKFKDEGKTADEITKLINLPGYDNFGFAFLKKQNVYGVYEQLK